MDDLRGNAALAFDAYQCRVGECGRAKRQWDLGAMSLRQVTCNRVSSQSLETQELLMCIETG